LDHKVDHENDLPTLLSETRRPPVDTHKRQLSQGTDICTQDLIERLDHHEHRLEQIVQQPSSQQVMTRTNTPALLEKLDGHALEVELLLQKGAAMLAGDDAISRHSTCESLTNQGEADNNSHSEDDEFSEADSTTASSSCGDSCSSSPRSFRLTSDDEDAQEQLRGLNIPAAQIMKLFDQMDFGGSGEISLEEFIDCCLRYSQGGMAERDLLQVHWDLRRQQTIKEQMQELQGDMKNHKEKWFQQLELVLNETRHQVQLVVQHADALSKQNREGRALGPESGSLECQIRSPQHASKSGEQRSTSSEQRWRSAEQQNGSLEKRSRSNPRNVIQQPDAWEEQSVPPIERHDKTRSIL